MADFLTRFRGLLGLQTADDVRRSTALEIAKMDSKHQIQMREEVHNATRHINEVHNRQYARLARRFNHGGKFAGSGEVKTLGSLKEARDRAKHIVQCNGYAVSMIQNAVNYTIGVGMRWNVELRTELKMTDMRDDDDPAAVELRREMIALNDEIERFRKFNRWVESFSEKAMVRRSVEAGELILRFFRRRDDLAMRFVNSDEVHPPNDKQTGMPSQEEKFSFGVETAPGDVGDILAFWINDKRIPADQIEYRKWNTDHNCKRGLTELFAVFDAYDDAVSLRSTMAITTRVQASFAVVRSNEDAATATQALEFANEDADVTLDIDANNTGGSEININQDLERLRYVTPGSIYDEAPGKPIKFPTGGQDMTRGIEVQRSVLREIGANHGQPPVLLSSDTQQGVHASVIESKGPSHLRFLSRQADQEGIHREAYTRALDFAASLPVPRVRPDWAKRFQIVVTGPDIVTTDGLKKAQESETLIASAVMSKQTAAERHGLDYNVERRRMAEEASLGADPEPPSLPIPA